MSDKELAEGFYDWWVGSGRRAEYDVLAEQAAYIAWIEARRSTPQAHEPDGAGEASCPTCWGTGDQGGNPSYGVCDDCGGSGRIATPQPTQSVQPMVITDEMVERAGVAIGRRLGFNPTKAFVEHKEIALFALTAALEGK